MHNTRLNMLCYLGLTIATTMALIICASSLLLFINIPVNAALFPICLTLSFVVSAKLCPLQNWKKYCFGILASLLIFTISFLVVGSVIDTSYDGNSYHKSAVAAFASGWNPLLGSGSTESSFIPLFSDPAPYRPSLNLWLETYAQGIWRLGASFYCFLHNIECGKAYTILAGISASLLLGYYLAYKGSLRSYQVALICLVSFLNPILLAQFLTYYVDGFLCMELLILLVGLCMYIDKDFVDKRLLAGTLISIGVISATAAKTSGLAYSAAFCLAFLVAFVIKVIERKPCFSLKALVKLGCFAILLVIANVLLFNFSPFVTNFLNHGNPLYPLFGEGRVDIMTDNSPKAFLGRNTLLNVISSALSSVDNIYYAAEYDPSIKAPLSVSQSELSVLYAPDLRINGFGVMYSAIFIILVILTPVMVFSSRKKYPSLFLNSICYLIPMLTLCLFIKESWWARYSGYTWFSIIPVMAFLFMVSNSVNSSRDRIKALASCILEIILVGLVVVNSFFFIIYGTSRNIEESREVKYGLNQMLGAMNSGREIEVAFLNGNDGFKANLTDYGIDYKMVSYDENENNEFDGAMMHDRIFYRLID